MSLSAEVKQELVSLRPVKNCCVLSELNALTQCCGSMALHGRGQVSIVYTTENVSVAKRIFILLKKGLEINASPYFNKINRFGGRRVCRIALTLADTRKLMFALHMLHESEEGEVFRGIPRRALTRRCCQQAFLRGSFLGSGSVSNPGRNQHLEFVCGDEKRADAIVRLLERNELEGGTTQRRGSPVVYLKKGAQIATLLGLMGATRSMMHYENALAHRSVRENVLRATNCDHNNTVRQLNAAEQQITEIRALQSSGLFDSLPDDLRTLSEARLQHPELSLEELGALMSPPISKSGVNHRFRKLKQLAQQQMENQGEKPHDHDADSHA